MLLVVRHYRGLQCAQIRRSRLHNLARITTFFASLNIIRIPAFSGPFVSLLEFVGGVLLMLGLFSRPIAFLLACNMFVANWTADHAALTSVFSDSDKFYVADPYTFLFASLMIVVFGSGLYAINSLFARRLKAVD